MKILRKSVMIAVGLLAAGQLFAQPAQPPSSPPLATPAVAVPRQSPEAMRKESMDLRTRVRADIQRLHHLRAKAKADKDSIALTCINDKFIKLKAEANIFDDAHRDLLAVIDTDDRGKTFDRVSAAALAVRKAREEADVCAGKTSLGTGTGNDVDAPNLFDDPTTGLPFDITIEPPAYASPYT